MDFIAAFIAEHRAVLGLVIFAAFPSERFPPSVVAVASAGLMLALAFWTP